MGTPMVEQDAVENLSVHYLLFDCFLALLLSGALVASCVAEVVLGQSQGQVIVLHSHPHKPCQLLCRMLSAGYST